MKRIINLNPGPAALPIEVLKKVQSELLDYEGTGMSIMEISHRSKEFENLLNNASALMREIYNIPSEYKILWLQGGASTQFFMIPANLMIENMPMDYVDTGYWAQKAIKEGKKYGNIKIVASSQDKNYSYIPEKVKFNENISYAHITSNNTIEGTQWHRYPKIEHAPLIVDMSSDFISKKIDIKKFGLIYAGAQKNLGPAGVTVVIIREDLVSRCEKKNLPTMIDYKSNIEENSLYNTPPCFNIYVCKLTLELIKSIGSLNEVEKRNRKKAEIIYNVIDTSDGYYKCHSEKNSRSIMNITFKLPTQELEDKFVNYAKSRFIVGIKGHRAVGGMRISLYNWVTVEDTEKVAEFLNTFKDENEL